MTKDEAIKHIIDIFVLDGDEWLYSFLKEEAAIKSAEALTILTGNKWVYVRSDVDPERFGIKPEGKL